MQVRDVQISKTLIDVPVALRNSTLCGKFI